ncbi:PaaX family transcriptional regulator C-terminal domain-containing protein [Shimia sp.]|uniref:PaaX family transcriptional regulator C-terminal domain-containing protein n=1 Tax=Shimia sp. TaxID=1954381 RepID=UPI0032989399
MPDTELKPDIYKIANCGPIRVWSVVVTILGDLCQNPDDFIPSRTLNVLVGKLGINNQALRVALHRLKRDGWIRAQRDGRTSNYYLSDQGRLMSESVRDQIYSKDQHKGVPMTMLMAPPQMPAAEFADCLPEEGVALSARVAIVTGPAQFPRDCLTLDFSPQNTPDWIIDSVAPYALQQEYAALEKAVKAALKAPMPPTLTDRTAMRLVILHHWRRLILRQNILADLLLPPNWPGAQARRQVMLALDRYERPQIDALNTFDAGAT